MTLPGERGSIKDQTHPPQIASRAQQITTITYYFHNQSEVEAYLQRLGQRQQQRYGQTLQHPSPMAERMRKLKAQRGLPSAS